MFTLSKSTHTSVDLQAAHDHLTGLPPSQSLDAKIKRLAHVLRIATEQFPGLMIIPNASYTFKSQPRGEVLQSVHMLSALGECCQAHFNENARILDPDHRDSESMIDLFECVLDVVLPTGQPSVDRAFSLTNMDVTLSKAMRNLMRLSALSFSTSWSAASLSKSTLTS